jgi:predicted RNase H-like HicB family nuclease
MKYVALVDGKAGAFGVSFPDAPGCTAMGKTMDAAIANAAIALAEWVGYSSANRLDVPCVRSIYELQQDADVVEQLADGARFITIA